MIKNKKGLLILVVFLVILYILISIILPGIKEYKNTVFIGSNTKIDITDGNIKVYNENKELSNQKVKIYYEKEFIDGYISSHHGDTHDIVYSVFNDKGVNLLPERIIAHTKDLSIKIKESDKKISENIDDISEFAKLNSINLSSNVELDYLYITSFDLDADSKDECIYSVGLIENNHDYKSIVYLKKDNKYIIIDKEESSYGIDSKKLYFTNLIDFNNDSNYEFVVEKMMSEYGPDYYELYNFDGKEFTKIGVEE